MSTPSRFKNGVNGFRIQDTLANVSNPFAIQASADFQDFHQYVAGDWTVTNTTSHATIALTAAASGVISLAGGAASVTNDIAAIIKNPLNFNFTTSQQLWFYMNLTLDVAANNLILAGITSANATAAVTDGIYFTKAAGAATVDFVVKASSTATTQSAVATLANATAVRLGFYYNPSANSGNGSVKVFVNDVCVYEQLTLTNLPNGVALAPGLAMKLAATAPTTAYANSDFIFAAQDRTNP